MRGLFFWNNDSYYSLIKRSGNYDSKKFEIHSRKISARLVQLVEHKTLRFVDSSPKLGKGFCPKHLNTWTYESPYHNMCLWGQSLYAAYWTHGVAIFQDNRCCPTRLVSEMISVFSEKKLESMMHIKKALYIHSTTYIRASMNNQIWHAL